MSRIRILPDILSNKIAAGEVVERPASVVKELAENALDAGASRILIDIEQGGRSLIRVADNGSGMNRDDALLAIERHATSKIASDEDLFNIRTLGFRGEALPSIAAVSHFSLVTRDAVSDAGAEITIQGGKLVNVAEAGAPAGTLVEIRQLFFNTPARRKFLKSIATEMAHIADILAGMALAWPAVQFRLTHNEKVVKNWPAAADPFERVVDVLGGGLRGDLHAISLAREGLSVGGWVSSPQVRRTSSNGIFILVNRRCVRDRLVQHALFQGYSQRLVKGQFPLAVLFIDVPCDQVDVNVHPAKNEVRFARSHDVHELIRQAVAQTLYDTDRPGFRQKTPETNQVMEEKATFGDRRFVGGPFRPDDRAPEAGGFANENRGWKAAPTAEQELPHTSVSSVGGASGRRSQSCYGGVGSSPDDLIAARCRSHSLTEECRFPPSTFDFHNPALRLPHPASNLRLQPPPFKRIFGKGGFQRDADNRPAARYLHRLRSRGRLDSDRPARRPRAGALR